MKNPDSHLPEHLDNVAPGACGGCLWALVWTLIALAVCAIYMFGTWSGGG